jgi:hypothetical protein
MLAAPQKQKVPRPNPVLGIENGQLVMRPIEQPDTIRASDYVPSRPRYDPIPPPDPYAMSQAYDRMMMRNAERDKREAEEARKRPEREAEEARKRAKREAEEQENKRMDWLYAEITKLENALKQKEQAAQSIEEEIKGTFIVDQTLVRLRREIEQIKLAIKPYNAELMHLQTQVNERAQREEEEQERKNQQQPQQLQQEQQQPPQPQPQPQQPQQPQQQQQQKPYSYNPASLVRGALNRFLPGKRSGGRSNKKGKKSTRRPNKKCTRRHSKKKSTRRH